MSLPPNSNHPTVHFLSHNDQNPNLHRPSPPPTVSFNGWLFPHPGWTEWALRMAGKHRDTWQKAGILEPILNSTYRIPKHLSPVLRLAEKWRPETNTFVFAATEAAVTLEDVVVIAGFSVIGRPVFSAARTWWPAGPDEEATEKVRRLEEERMRLVKTTFKKATHLCWLRRFGGANKDDIEHEAFLALWLSRFVFPGGAKDTVMRRWFGLAVQLARGIRFAVGPAVLAGIYRDLTIILCRKDNIVVWSPFQLVLIWIWERFSLLSPVRSPAFLSGGPRHSHWHNSRNARDTDIILTFPGGFDSRKLERSFVWRPYASGEHPVSRRFYGEGEWRVVREGIDDDFASFARCMRPGELVGVDISGRVFVEKYLTNRVTRQFGFQQDVPFETFLNCENIDPVVAWESYDRPIRPRRVYFPSRFSGSPGVSLEYWENWWKKCKRGGGDDVEGWIPTTVVVVVESGEYYSVAFGGGKIGRCGREGCENHRVNYTRVILRKVNENNGKYNLDPKLKKLEIVLRLDKRGRVENFARVHQEFGVEEIARLKRAFGMVESDEKGDNIIHNLRGKRARFEGNNGLRVVENDYYGTSLGFHQKYVKVGSDLGSIPVFNRMFDNGIISISKTQLDQSIDRNHDIVIKVGDYYDNSIEEYESDFESPLEINKKNESVTKDGNSNDFEPPPGFHRKYGGAIKGENEDEKRAYWKIWCKGESSETRSVGEVGLALLDLEGSEDAIASLIENEAGASEGLRKLGVEIIKVGKSEKSDDDSGKGKGLEPRDWFTGSSARARGIRIPDLNT